MRMSLDGTPSLSFDAVCFLFEKVLPGAKVMCCFFSFAKVVPRWKFLNGVLWLMADLESLWLSEWSDFGDRWAFTLGIVHSTPVATGGSTNNLCSLGGNLRLLMPMKSLHSNPRNPIDSPIWIHLAPHQGWDNALHETACSFQTPAPPDWLTHFHAQAFDCAVCWGSYFIGKHAPCIKNLSTDGSVIWTNEALSMSLHLYTQKIWSQIHPSNPSNCQSLD